MIGLQIRRYRLERRLTQKELGQASGVNASTIGSYEAGNVAIPSDESLALLATALGVTPDDLRADLPDDYCPDVRLTKDQQATLDFWLRYKLAKGSVPTIKETQAATGHSKAAIYGHLKKLRRLGLLPAYEGSVPTAAAIAKVRQEVSRGLAEGWLHLSPHHQEVFGDVLELLEDGA